MYICRKFNTKLTLKLVFVCAALFFAVLVPRQVFAQCPDCYSGTYGTCDGETECIVNLDGTYESGERVTAQFWLCPSGGYVRIEVKFKRCKVTSHPTCTTIPVTTCYELECIDCNSARWVKYGGCTNPPAWPSSFEVPYNRWCCTVDEHWIADATPWPCP